MLRKTSLHQIEHRSFGFQDSVKVQELWKGFRASDAGGCRKGILLQSFEAVLVSLPSEQPELLALSSEVGTVEGSMVGFRA